MDVWILLCMHEITLKSVFINTPGFFNIITIIPLFFLFFASLYISFIFQSIATTVFDFSTTLKNYHDFQKWLIEVGLVPESKICPDCEGSMWLEPGKPLWIFSKRAKHPNKKTKKMSLYKNTIFEGHKSQRLLWKFAGVFL